MAKKFFEMENTSYTQNLAEYACRLQFEDLPAAVIQKAKIMTLHTIGVSLAARPEAFAQSVTRVARRANGTGGGASAWSSGEKLSMTNAAYVNGTLADLLDWEDCSWTGHPSAGVIPVAVAVAESEQKSGKAFLESVVTGFEVYSRVAMAVQPESGFDHNQGWGLCSWQIFAGAAAAAKLLGLDVQKTNQTYGMACLYSAITSNLMQATMSNAYHYQHGLAAQNGLLAALSVQEGIENLENAFDIPYAYGEHLTTKVDKSWFNRDLDGRFLILEILIKHWPANMWLQTPIEIVSALAREHQIKPEQVEEIIIDPPTQYRMHTGGEGFSSLMEAEFSIPYVVAACLLDPAPGPNWYTKEQFTSPVLLELAGRVKSGSKPQDTLMHSFELFQSGSYPEKTVTIRLKDGTVYERTQKIHKGHPDDMFTWEEITALFRRQASFAISPEKAEDIIHFIETLEEQPDFSAFNQFLQA